MRACKSSYLKRDATQCKKICPITHDNGCCNSRIIAKGKKKIQSFHVDENAAAASYMGENPIYRFVLNTTDIVWRVRSSSEYCHFLFNLLSRTSYTSTPHSAASISQQPRTRGNAQPPRLRLTPRAVFEKYFPPKTGK